MEMPIDGRVCKAGKSVRGSSTKISSSEAAMVRHEKSVRVKNHWILLLEETVIGYGDCHGGGTLLPALPNLRSIGIEEFLRRQRRSNVTKVHRDYRPVYQHWAVDYSEEFITALSTWEGHENPRELFKKWVEDVVRLEVEAGIGLYWELRMWERSATRPNEFVVTM
ncbi:hypothetical protein R1sor_006633 [Riccia sorocarpa]|uniref:Uncharacterized protein n=1 Tax=Riccia sorocarpa TaxID=122646 RepID=A0ABD3HRL0_9MARC